MRLRLLLAALGIVALFWIPVIVIAIRKGSSWSELAIVAGIVAGIILGAANVDPRFALGLAIVIHGGLLFYCWSEYRRHD